MVAVRNLLLLLIGLGGLGLVLLVGFGLVGWFVSLFGGVCFFSPRFPLLSLKEELNPVTNLHH